MRKTTSCSAPRRSSGSTSRRARSAWPPAPSPNSRRASPSKPTRRPKASCSPADDAIEFDEGDLAVGPLGDDEEAPVLGAIEDIDIEVED